MADDNTLASYESQIKQTKDKDKDKESIITLLKSRIFELEQNEKNYEALNSLYTHLQKDLTKVNEEKLKSEYEMKHKTEIQSKKIVDLISDNENFQQIINDKIQINKKLYSDNEILLTQLDALGKEYEDLQTKHTDLELQYESIGKERNKLSDIKAHQETEIRKLFEDNKKLNSIWKEQDYSIKQYEQNKIQFIAKIEEISYELTNLKGKLKSKEENLTFVKSQNEETKQSLNETQISLKQIEKENEELKAEIAKEKENCEKGNKEIDDLNVCIEEYKKTIEKYASELEAAMQNNIEMKKESSELIKEEMNMFANENNKLISVIENFLDQDEKMKGLLKRKEKVIALIQKSNQTIDNTLNSL